MSEGTRIAALCATFVVASAWMAFICSKDDWNPYLVAFAALGLFGLLVVVKVGGDHRYGGRR